MSSPLREAPLDQLAHSRTVAAMIADPSSVLPPEQKAFQLSLYAGGEADGADPYTIPRAPKRKLLRLVPD